MDESINCSTSNLIRMSKYLTLHKLCWQNLLWQSLIDSKAQKIQRFMWNGAETWRAMLNFDQIFLVPTKRDFNFFFLKKVFVMPIKWHQIREFLFASQLLDWFSLLKKPRFNFFISFYFGPVMMRCRPDPKTVARACLNVLT